MTGQPVEIPWAPGAKYTRIICRLGEPRPDGADADENPDLMTQGGIVTLTCTAKKIRYAEEDGRSRMLTTRSWTFRVRLSDGELYNTESDNVGVKILSGSSAGVDPANFTWTATVTPDSGEVWGCTIPPTAGDTFDLVSNADVAVPSPGESTLTQRVKALEDAGLGTGGGGLDTEAVQDVVGAMVTGAGGTYDDGAGTITLPSGGGSGPTAWDDIPDKPAVIAAGPDAAEARTAIGAGTSDLAIGTTGTTAAAGNRQATESATGMVELATTAEATAGTDTARAVTPAAGRAAGDARYVRTVNGTGPDANGDVAVSGGGGWELIASTPVVGGGTATFANIPQTYDKLRLEWLMSSTAAGGRNCALTCNGDSGANYATSGNAGGQSSIPILASQAGRAQGFVECHSYRAPNGGGHIFAGQVVGNTNAGNNNIALTLIGGAYLVDAAITSLSMTMSHIEEGVFYLYGATR